MSTEINLINKIIVLDEGTIITSDARSLNFTGPGVTATSVGDDVTINITGGGGGGSVTDVTASTPLFSTGGTTPDISIQQASALQSGFLSSTDWSDFNSKVASSLLGANNGVATLDSGGKVPVTQLPNSIMDYKGTYDIITNTPTLVNGTGNAGDVYINTAAGTRDFGTGPITVAIGDWLVYDGSVWQKSINSNAVASVNGYTGIVVLNKSDIGLSNVENTALSTWAGSSNITTVGTIGSGIWNGTPIGDSYISSASTWNAKQNALTIGNITESISSVLTITGGTGAIIGSGLSLQVKQANTTQNGYLSSTDWNTFNNKGSGSVTSVGLSMPSAFSVASSPVTGTGTIAVTGAGTTAQYVRGDGTLANFPSSTGGGSSLTFYLNGSVSQGTFGGVAFKEMDRTPVLGAGTDFTINANGYIQSFITNAGVPGLLEIPAGNWNFETYFSASSSGGTPSFYIELYKWDGATLSLIASNSANPEGITGGTVIDLYISALAVPQTTLLATDRLAVRIYVTHSSRTITLHTENSHICQIITTFSTGLTALNGLTAQVQNLAVGTTGTDFAISSVGTTHTFKLPTASAINRGALSAADWSIFNSKGSGTVTSVAALTLGTTGTDVSSSVATGTTTPVITLNIPTASATNRGVLSSTNWTIFNNKIDGSGTINYLSKFTASGTIGNSLIQDDGTTLAIGATPVSTAQFKVNTSAARHAITADTNYTGAGSYYSFYGVVSGARSSDSNIAIRGEASNSTIENTGGIFTSSSAGTAVGYGVSASASNSGTGLTIGGRFAVSGASTQKYSLELVDGTESVAGRFLKNIVNGRANWATLTVADTGLTLTTTGSSGSASLISDTLNIPTYTLAGLGGIGLTSLTASTPLSYNNTTGAFSIQVATTSQNGYLSSTDWTTFNGKVGGSGTANYLSKFTASGTIGNSLIQDNGTYLGISTAPVTGVRVTVDGVANTAIRGNTTGNGKYGLHGSNVNDGPGTFTGVFGASTDNGSSFAGSVYVGGRFFASNGNNTTDVYSLWLQDGTESIGRFLKSITADGKSQWATLTVADTGLTITTTGTSGAATLVGNTLNIPLYSGGTSTFNYGLSYAMASQNILL